MSPQIIYLVRHGQYDSTDQRKLGGSLTVIGREQAMLTARRLSQFPSSTIHYSTLHRAAQTAEIIAKSFPRIELRASRALWECIPGVPAQLSQEFIGYPLKEIVQGPQKAERAFVRYFRPGRADQTNQIIVCHGNLIRYFVCRVLEVETKAWAKMYTHNCGITEISIDKNGRMMLVSLNDVGHLPSHIRTLL